MKILLLIINFLLITISYAQIKPSPIEQFDFSIHKPILNLERQPMFPGCKNIQNKWDKLKCAEEKMNNWIYSNLKYPAEAKERKIEGTCFATFIVERSGIITNLKLKRNIGYGCGEETLRLIKNMPEWIPGFTRNRSVRVQYDIKIKFELDSFISE